MGYQSNPSGLGVGKRYGARFIDTKAGVYKSSDSELEAIITINHEDTSSPLEVTLPPYAEITSVEEMCKEAWSSSKKVILKLDGNAIATAAGDALGTTVGTKTAFTLTTTTANLRTGNEAKKLVATPPTDTKGRSILIIKMTRV